MGFGVNMQPTRVVAPGAIETVKVSKPVPQSMKLIVPRVSDPKMSKPKKVFND